MSFLLDTCVISEITAKQPNANVMRWLHEINDDHVYLSVITVGEIQRGISKLGNTRRRHELEEWLQNDLVVRFNQRILPLTLSVMLTWGQLTAQGRTLPAVDSMIAALSLHHGLTLVTRNVMDFDGTGVKLLNPWEG